MYTKALKSLPLALLLASSATAVLAAGREPSEKKEKSITIAEDDVVLSDGDEPFVFRFSDRARRGRIGVRLLEMTPELRAHYGAPRDAGVLVAGVEKDSPAAKAGIQVGDIITRAGGDPVESALDLSRALRHAKAGDTLKLDVSRDRASRQLTIKVEERGDVEIDLGDLGHDLGRDLGRHFGRDLGRDIRREIGRHAWVFRDPVIRERHVYRDLPEIRDRIQERMEQLEKRLRELEKKLPAR
jgi:hypothetical protein